MDRLKPSSTHLELHIEELVFRGVSARDRDRIESAITQELTRLLADQGIPQSFGSGNPSLRLEGGSFQVTAGRPAAGIGTEIAQAIYGGFGTGEVMTGEVMA
jgi:hypothetical protein